MSTSYSGNTKPSSRGFESFVYQNTGNMESSPEVLPVQADEPIEPKTKGDGVPRISEAELSRLLGDARAEGKREGEQQARAMFEEGLEQQRSLVTTVLTGFEQERSEYYSKVEMELVHFALAIAAKILHREAQIDRMVVAGLVKVMLEKLQQGTKVKARVRPEEASSWRHYFQDNENLEIVEDAALAPKDCKLETELGTAEMGLDAQLKEIEKGFFDLLAQRPQPK